MMPPVNSSGMKKQMGIEVDGAAPSGRDYPNAGTVSF
jgi:hypothetical protein